METRLPGLTQSYQEHRGRNCDPVTKSFTQPYSPHPQPSSFLPPGLSPNACVELAKSERVWWWLEVRLPTQVLQEELVLTGPGRGRLSSQLSSASVHWTSCCSQRLLWLRRGAHEWHFSDPLQRGLCQVCIHPVKRNVNWIMTTLTFAGCFNEPAFLSVL